ncbi:MAG: hypothetical protein IPL19_01775 [Sandaracinaceae bacterium]|nr:hypothetical protein [Sandaracinaceae bacterium]
MDATMADVKRARRLIEDGFPIPTVMGARRENAQRAFSLYETGASRDDVRATFRLKPCATSGVTFGIAHAAIRR